MQQCRGGGEGFRVLVITGKGADGEKKNHMGSFFSPTTAFSYYGFIEAAICYQGNVFPATPLAA